MFLCREKSEPHAAVSRFTAVGQRESHRAAVDFETPHSFAALSFSNGAVQPRLPSDFNMTIPDGPDSATFAQLVATGQHVADGTLNLLSTSFVSETRTFTNLVFTHFALGALTDTEAISFAYDTSTITVLCKRRDREAHEASEQNRAGRGHGGHDGRSISASGGPCVFAIDRYEQSRGTNTCFGTAVAERVRAGGSRLHVN